MTTRLSLAGLVGSAIFAYMLLAGAPVQAQSSGFAYKPPLRGVPDEATRVGGGTRGAEGRTFTLSVLAPDHIGLTTREQPTLLWFASEQVTTPVQITVVDPNRIEPLLDVQLEPPLKPGIQAISLREHGVRLDPDVDYQWFVALVTDPEHRSQDIIAGGEIRRVAPPQGVGAVGEVPSGEQLRAYAEAGIWYDTIDGLSQLIAKQPGDPALREQRASLLEQVGLSEAAAFERRGS